MTSAMADVKPPDHAKPTRRERTRATRLRITRAAAAEPDIGAALSSIVRGVGEIIRRAAPLDTVVRAAGSHDPEAAAVWEYHERLRIDGYGRIVAVLAKKAPLRPGVTLDRATDLFLFYLGPLAYVGLVMDRGWSYDDWLEWTVATLLELVFAP